MPRGSDIKTLANKPAHSVGTPPHEMIERLPVPLAHISADGRVSYVNGAFEAIFGLPRETMIGQAPADLPSLAGLDEDGHRVNRALAGHGTSIDHHITTADGSARDYAVSYLPISDGGCDIMMIDVTDHRRSMKTLEEREKRHELALNSGRLGIWEWDLDAHTVQVSSRFQPSGDNTSVTLDFDDWASYLHAEDRDAVETARLVVAAYVRHRAG